MSEAKGAISREQEAAEKLRQAMATAQQEAQYQVCASILRVRVSAVHSVDFNH